MPVSASLNTFRKAEKLCSQIQIDKLFSEGKSLSSRNFRLIYLETDTARIPVVKLLIAVPKKNFKHAVDRNRMKRLIREVYRTNKHKLLNLYLELNRHCDFAIVFTGKKCINYKETQVAIIEILDRFILSHEENTE
jgi:ribonuclease P protein component